MSSSNYEYENTENKRKRPEELLWPKHGTKQYEKMVKWKNSDLVTMFKEELSFDDEDLATISKQLKGRHLINSIQDFRLEINNNTAPITAKQSMITSLMKEQKVTDVGVAESIAGWLIESFIENNSITSKKVILEPYHYKYEYEETDIDRKYIIRKSFLQEEEELFLQELEQYNLKDLTTPNIKTSDPLRFNLKHREKTIEQILQVGKKHFENYHLADKGKQQLHFFIAKGGSGCGKTRILTEIPNILRNGKELDAIFENTNIIYFNFANGFPLSDTERDNKPVSMILSRIIHASFENAIELLKNTPASENDLFLYEVMRIISQKLHLKYGKECVIPLVLAFDEYQLATRANNDLHTSIQHKLGWYMRKIQNTQQILLFPAFGGTLNDAKMEPTQYTPALLALPSLRSIDIEAIMTDAGLSDHYSGKFREFWNAIGIVPRHLEWALGNDVNELKSIVLNDKIVRKTIYDNVVSIVHKQYHTNLYDPYLGELALITISGLSKHSNEKLDQYISEGKVYVNGGFIGIPLVVIDILATTMNYIPKCVVSDFITASDKPLWEKFEELFLKTMTARFNILYSIPHSEKVQFSELFKGAYFKSNLGFISLKTTNSSWFKYEESSNYLSNNAEQNEKIISPICLKKAKKNQDDIDGVLCTLTNADTNKRILFITQNKFQESQQRTTLEPAELVTFYEKAVRTTFKDSDTFVIIFTNKSISKKTQDMIIKGQITKSTKTNEGTKQVTVDCGKLIVVSGDCFCNFFHPFITNLLVEL